MAHHIVLSVPFDLATMQEGAERDENPRHVFYGIGRRLNAEVHLPQSTNSKVDRVLAKIFGQPQHWTTARELAPKLDATHTVFCAGDDSGIPLVLVTMFRRRTRRPKIAIWTMAPERTRQRIFFRLLRKRIDLFIANTQAKVEALRRIAGGPPDRVFLWSEQTDTEFFTPGPKHARDRPLIFSAGREQRDYLTLARATENLAVDVEICALSPNANDKTPGTFPDPVPANMSFHPYPWPEFRQAYRDADIVVVPLLDNDYSAGATAMLEAMACRRPVVVSRVGLAADFIDAGVVAGYEPGDAAGLRRVIEDLLANSANADALAARAHDLITREHSALVVRESLIHELESLGRTTSSRN